MDDQDRIPRSLSALSLITSGVGLVRPEEQVLDAMLDGWERQMLARNLSVVTVRNRRAQVRAFVEHSNEYPWTWMPRHADEWFADLRSVKGLALSTIRNYQVGLRIFGEYVTDPAYEWPLVCQERFDAFPTQVLNEVNSAAHVADYEGLPTRRAFTLAELESLFAHVDATALDRAARGTKGWASVFRDGVIFKLAYGYGMRRNEVRMLDVTDFSPNPHAPEFGAFGVLLIRHGKAQRGSAPKRRSVLTVWPWTVDVVQQYLQEVRPLLHTNGGDALFPTERGERIAGEVLSRRLRAYCDELGLDPALTFHSLRRSYVTTLMEQGFELRFVQDQVGHDYGSTTSLYTCVSSDFRVRTLRRALDADIAQAVARTPTEKTLEGTR